MKVRGIVRGMLAWHNPSAWQTGVESAWHTSVVRGLLASALARLTNPAPHRDRYPAPPRDGAALSAPCASIFAGPTVTPKKKN